MIVITVWGRDRSLWNGGLTGQRGARSGVRVTFAFVKETIALSRRWAAQRSAACVPESARCSVNSAADDERNPQWERDAWQAMDRFSNGGVYVNFLTEDEGPERAAPAYASVDMAASSSPSTIPTTSSATPSGIHSLT
jgi:hypothetical protein